MTRKPLLITIFLILGYGFWVSPDLKTIAAGVSISLLGMMSLEDGFKSFTGGVLEKFLQKTTDTTFKSLSFGVVSTTLMQSSSLISVITISFISAGLIALGSGIGIIFGANLGTTTGAWLVAGLGLKVDIAAYAMPMLVFGVILMFQKDEKALRGAGYLLAGLGFLFLGIAFMKEGFETFREQFDLAQFAVGGFAGLMLYTTIGIAATVVMQSSHATLILTITALAAGQVSYENALALAIGSNVGTTITAVLGALSANAAGRRLAGAHLIFNLTTGLIAILFIQQFGTAVNWTSDLLGIAEDNYTLKLAVFHTLFNLVGVALMVPLIGLLVRLLEGVIPEKKEGMELARPLYLSESAMQFPDTAFNVLRQEIRHMADNTFEILAQGLNLHREDILSRDSLTEIVARAEPRMAVDVEDLYHRRVKPLYSACLDFSTRAEAGMLPQQISVLHQMKQGARRVVDAIKLMREMQPNFRTYASSNNAYMRGEYNKLRRHLARLLRALFGMEDIHDLAAIRDRIGQLRLEMEEDDAVANGTLDKLIREGLISSEMATSLMNDSAFAYELHTSLIEAAEALFGSVTTWEKQSELVEPALESALDQKQTEIARRLKDEQAEIDALKMKAS